MITDVGSVKASVAEALSAAAPEGVFVVPGHPIAGTEQSGPDAGFAELFHNRWVILTPLKREDDAYLEAVQRLGSQRLQDKQVERALQQVGSFVAHTPIAIR